MAFITPVLTRWSACGGQTAGRTNVMEIENNRFKTTAARSLAYDKYVCREFVLRTPKNTKPSFLVDGPGVEYPTFSATDLPKTVTAIVDRPSSTYCPAGSFSRRIVGRLDPAETPGEAIRTPKTATNDCRNWPRVFVVCGRVARRNTFQMYGRRSKLSSVRTDDFLSIILFGGEIY